MLFLQKWLREAVPADLATAILDFHRRAAWSFANGLNRPLAGTIPEELADELNRSDRYISVFNTLYELRDFDQTIAARLPPRKSTDNFSGDVSFKEKDLRSFIMEAYCDTTDGYHPYPSAGGLYPVHAFLCIRREFKGIKTGLYNVIRNRQKIELLRPMRAPELDSFMHLCTNTSIGDPALLIVYAINIDVCLVKYGYRGYRFAMMEVGSAYMRAEMVAHAHGLGSRVYGGFSDSVIMKEAGLSVHEFLPCAVQCIGAEQH